MDKYIYDGPVLEFGKCVQHRWRSQTKAVSEKQARNNFAYQWKKQHNMPPNAKVTLPGEIIFAF